MPNSQQRRMRGEGREGAKARCHESGKRPWQRTGSGQTHAHTHSHMCTRTHSRTHVHTITHMHTNTHMHSHTCALVHMRAHMHTCTHALTHARTHRLPETSAFPSPFSCRMTFPTAPGVTCPSLCRQAPGVGRPNGAPQALRCAGWVGVRCILSRSLSLGPCRWLGSTGTRLLGGGGRA